MLVTGDEQDYQWTVMLRTKQPFCGRQARPVAYLAPNYRMTEMQGAVALPLKKLPDSAQPANRYGEQITEGIRDLRHLSAFVREGNKSSYWFYMFRVDEAELGCSGCLFLALAAGGSQLTWLFLPCSMLTPCSRQDRRLGTHFPSTWLMLITPLGLSTAEEVLATAIG